MTKRIGILGGLGPMASAEFLKTIYELAGKNCEEQAMPKIFMLSDPGVPDRSAAIISGKHEALLDAMIERLNYFNEMQPDKIVICCVAMHYFIPRLPDIFRNKIISILDSILEYMQRNPAVILCASASRQAKMFENHASWPKISSHTSFLTDEKQSQLDGMIRCAKRDGASKENMKSFSNLVQCVEQERLVVACSEVHMLAKGLSIIHRKKIYDPFLEIAKQLI